MEFSGCGLGPENTYCTQIAVFLHSASNQEELLSYTMRENLTLNRSSSIFPVCVNKVEGTGSAKNRSTSISSPDSYKILFDFDYPVDSRTQDEQDRDHTLARFQSLKHYLITGERKKQSYLDWEGTAEDGKVENCTETLAQNSDSLESQSQQTSPLLKDSESSDDELVFFLVEYVKTEKGITPKKMANNEYVFYIVDNEYAVIPMESLSKWVNLSADHMIPASLIRYRFFDIY